MKSFTIAERHDGTEVMLHGLKTPIATQLETYRSLVHSGSHREYASVTRIDTLGTVKVLRFTPEPAPAKAMAPEVEPIPTARGTTAKNKSSK